MTLFQIGTVAITSDSLPALFAIPAFVSVGLWLSIKNRLFGTLDIALLCAISAIQLMTLPLVTDSYTSQLNIFVLSWPVITFLFGYGAWRLSGRKPLQHWPWYRFGLLTTLLLLTVDLAGAFLITPTPGRVWLLGGAGMMDALVLGPPALTLAFYGVLDCRSPLVFCGAGCRNANKCLHNMVPLAKTTKRTTLPVWKRILLSTVLALVTFLTYAGMCQKDPKAKEPIPIAVAMNLNEFVEGMAAKYGIEEPSILNTGDNTVAFTRKTQSGAHVEIVLGELFAKKPELVDDLDNAKAVLGHEFGHALLFARDQGYPGLLVIAVYVLTLAALLGSMPTKRGIFLAGLLIFIALVTASAGFGVNTNSAIRRMVIGSVALGVLVALRWNATTACRDYFKDHSPTRYAILLASIAAATILFAGMPLIGTLNTKRELFADKIAACEAGQTQIIKVLNLLHPGNQSVFEEWIFDPFHPAPNVRFSALSGLTDQDLAKACKELR